LYLAEVKNGMSLENIAVDIGTGVAYGVIG